MDLEVLMPVWIAYSYKTLVIKALEPIQPWLSTTENIALLVRHLDNSGQQVIENKKGYHILTKISMWSNGVYGVFSSRESLASKNLDVVC